MNRVYDLGPDRSLVLAGHLADNRPVTAPTQPSGTAAVCCRLVIESVVIVASILLAFSIDAWWGEHQERGRETALLRGLLRDFQSSRPALEARQVLAGRMARNNALLTERLSEPGASGSVTVPDSLVLAVIGGPTYEATTNVLDAAVASGEIERAMCQRCQAIGVARGCGRSRSCSSLNGRSSSGTSSSWSGLYRSRKASVASIGQS